MTEMTKADLRKQARARRRDFARNRGTALFPLDAASLRPLMEVLAPGHCLAGYVAMASEADPIDLLAQWHKRGQPLALPWIGPEASPMLFRQWQPGNPLEMAEAGFAQPRSEAPLVVPDVLLIPLLGFDRAGSRLGQGAGYYDRALAQTPHARRIGLGWSVQEFADLPADPWDMPLDAILTEAEWITPPSSRITL
ncbi:MAG: 5-formyltetrahydrofolate cyclo-ligase [Chakrabartia sp.]